MTRGLAAIAAVVLLVAGCSGSDEDQSTHVIDEEAWRVSYENHLRGDDGLIAWDDRRQDRLPTPVWEDVAEEWRELCALPEDEMRDALFDFTTDRERAETAQMSVRYACPDRLDIADDALGITAVR